MSEQPIRIDDSIPRLRIAVFGESSPFPLVIRSDEVIEGWMPYVVDPTRDESRRVPTTIEYGDSLYAISKMDQYGEGMEYRLVPWPEGEIVRCKVTLSRAAWEQAQQEKRLEKQREGRDRIARSLGFLIAFLPAAVQDEISAVYDYDAAGWTKINSVVVGVIALSSAVVNLVIAPIAAGFGVGLGYPAIHVTFLTVYFLLDSLVRFTQALAADRPLGLLPGEVVYRLYGAMSRKWGRKDMDGRLQK